jgi:hypothetical protein
VQIARVLAWAFFIARFGARQIEARQMPDDTSYLIASANKIPVVEEKTPKTPTQKHHHIDRRAADLLGEVEKALPPSDEDLLSTPEVAAWLRVSTQFLTIGRHRGYGPKFLRLSPRRCRYRRGDVKDWLRERVHQSTAEYAK